MNKKIFGLLSLCMLFASCANDGANKPVESSETKYDSKWEGQLGQDIVKNFGVDFPYISADEKSYQLSVDTWNDPTMMIYCFYDDEDVIETKIEEYAQLCVAAGYDVTFDTCIGYSDDYLTRYYYDVYFADIEIDGKYGIELQFLEGAIDGKEAMGIYGFVYPIYDKTKWPSNIVERLLDKDIPHPEENEYEYTAKLCNDNGKESGNYIEVLVNNTDYEYETSMYNIFKDAGYSIYEEEYDEYGYIAISPDKTYAVQFIFDINYYLCVDILIYML